jgi:hypothetical protein
MKHLLIFNLLALLMFGCQNRNSGPTTAPVSQQSETVGLKEMIPQKIKDYVAQNLPGYTIVDTSDYIKAWWSFYDKHQIPCFITMDFNDDQVSDYAMLLKNANSLRLVILTASGNSFTQWMPDDFNEVYKGNDVQFGLSIEPPGRIDCLVDNKEQSLVLQSNGIALMALEQKVKVYYWSSGKYNLFRVTSKPSAFIAK